MKKFELTGEFIVFQGKKLFKIKALIDFGDVKRGEFGGFLEKEENLSQDGDAWVDGNARVSGSAWVYGDARVSGDAWVDGDAWVSGSARVDGNARVSGSAWVDGNARVYGSADYACVKGFGRSAETLLSLGQKMAEFLLSVVAFTERCKNSEKKSKKLTGKAKWQKNT